MASAPASAEGLYFSAAGGVSLLQNADNSNIMPPVDVTSTYDGGWAIGGAVGYALPTGLRLEAEVAYREVSLDELKIAEDGGLGVALVGAPLNGVTTPADGRETALSVMGNIWYDIDTGTPLTPYLGGGIGFARIPLDEVSVGGVEIVNDRDTVFAYQLGVGLAYALTDHVSVTVDYRFFGTTPATFTDITGDFRSEFHNHSVMAGMRLRF